MTPVKPYLIRAVYEWIIDNGDTPYIAVDTTFPNVSVPTQYIEDNTIILNISSISTNHLLINNEHMTFQARFGGIGHEIYIPISAIISIYSAENNQGMNFPKEEPPKETSTNIPPIPSKKDKLQLKVIKGEKD